jgi:hypothetical protein
LWGHELRQEPCSGQALIVRDVRAWDVDRSLGSEATSVAGARLESSHSGGLQCQRAA